MKQISILVLVGVSLSGCGVAPRTSLDPGPGSIPAASAPPTSPSLPRVPPRPNIAERPPMPEPKSKEASSDAAPDPCLSATLEGSVGNCVEPSLVVSDACEQRRYAVSFNDCITSPNIDFHALTGGGAQASSATVSGSTTETRARVVALRGTVGPGVPIGLGDRSFDIEVDVEEHGVIATKRLRGQVGPNPPAGPH